MKIVFILFGLFFLTCTTLGQAKLENLGDSINTIYSELRPTISADGKTLYFVIQGSPQNKEYKKDKTSQQVWFSKLDSTGIWNGAQQFPMPYPSQTNNTIFWTSLDGNTILIRGAYDNGKYLGRGFSFCKKINNEWTFPNQLKILGYDSISLDQYDGAFLTNDQKTLLLYMSENKNSSLNDIYVSHYNNDNTWSIPSKILDSVSLEDYDDISPFMASDGITLYFSSNRPGGFGGYDIWMSNRLDDTWTKWSQPVNLGMTVNTSKQEAYFSVDARGEYAYVVSTFRSIGGTDLAKILLDETLRPKPVVLISGKVYNAETRQPAKQWNINYETIDQDSASNEPNGTIESIVNKADGSYKTLLPYGNKYKRKVSAKDLFSIVDTLDLNKKGNYKEIKGDFYLNPDSTVSSESTTSDENRSQNNKKSRKKSEISNKGQFSNKDSLYKKELDEVDDSVNTNSVTTEIPKEVRDQIDFLIKRVDNGGLDGETAKQELQLITTNPAGFFKQRREQAISRSQGLSPDESGIDLITRNYDSIIQKIEKLSAEEISAISSSIVESGKFNTYNRSNIDSKNDNQQQLDPAFSFKANNTSNVGASSYQPFHDEVQQVYTDKITWIGNSPPSGVTNHTYQWTRIGNLVTLRVSLLYSNIGNNCTAVSFDLPSDCPRPSEPLGFRANNSILYFGTGYFLESSTSLPTSINSYTNVLKKKSSGPWYEIYIVTGQSVNPINCYTTIQYYSNQ